MENKVHERVAEINASIKSLSDHIQKSLGGVDKSFFEVQERMAAIRGLSKMEGQTHFNELGDFFANRFDSIISDIQKASVAQLRANQARLENLRQIAAQSLNGSKQGEGVYQQYSVLVTKLDEELKSRQKLSFQLGNFLKRNSIDAISIVGALTTRNPIIGLGIKFLLEKRAAAKEERNSQRKLSIYDSLAYRDLLNRQKDNLLSNRIDENGIRIPSACRGGRNYFPGPGRRKKQYSPGRPRKKTPYNYPENYNNFQQDDQYEGAAPRYHRPAADTTVEGEFWDIPKDRALGEGSGRDFNWPPRFPTNLLGVGKQRNRDEKGRFAAGYREDNFVPNQKGVLAIVAAVNDLKIETVKLHKEDHELDEEKEQQTKEEHRAETERENELFNSVKLLGPGKTMGPGNALIKHEPGFIKRAMEEGVGVAVAPFIRTLITKVPGFNKIPFLGAASALPAAAGTLPTAASGTSVGAVAASGTSVGAVAAGGTLPTAASGTSVGAVAASGTSVGAVAAGGMGIGRLAGPLIAFAVDGILGVLKSDQWKTSKASAGLGGTLGGSFKDPLLNAFSQAGKYALLGATLGAPGGPPGMIAGGLIGAGIGGIMGMIGGEKIANFMEKTGVGRFVTSFTKMIGTGIVKYVKIMITAFKVLAVGLKVIGNLLTFAYDTAIKPLTSIYEKTVAPILEPLTKGMSKYFGFFSDMFDWVSKLLSENNDFDNLLDGLLNNTGNVFSDIMSAMQRSLLDFAAGLLEKVPKIMDPFGTLHDAAKSLREKSARMAQNDFYDAYNAQPTPGSIKGPSSPTTITAKASSPQPTNAVASNSPNSSGVSALPVLVGKPTTSQSEINNIKAHEGFASTAYPDPSGQDKKFSIGYGHQIQPGETFTTLTESQASALLLKDLPKYEKIVNDAIKVPISQEMFDALLDFTYNVGGKGLKSVAGLVNKNDIPGALAKMREYNKIRKKDGTLSVSPSLNKRREEEITRFSSTPQLYVPQTTGPTLTQTSSNSPKMVIQKSSQGAAMMTIKNQTEDAKAARASTSSSGNNIVVAPSSQTNNTAVISQQLDPRNVDDTYRDIRNRTGYNT